FEKILEVSAELLAAGSRMTSELVSAQLLPGGAEQALSVQLGDLSHLAYSHANQALFSPMAQHTKSCFHSE
ncbi:Os02g0566000, partial [Oryza sativa Japonica Group]